MTFLAALIILIRNRMITQQHRCLGQTHKKRNGIIARKTTKISDKYLCIAGKITSLIDKNYSKTFISMHPKNVDFEVVLF